MSTLEVTLIGIVIGFVLLASVFRPNQVGTDGGGRNSVSFLFILVLGILGSVYLYDQIKEDYNSPNANQEWREQERDQQDDYLPPLVSDPYTKEEQYRDLKEDPTRSYDDVHEIPPSLIQRITTDKVYPQNVPKNVDLRDNQPEYFVQVGAYRNHVQSLKATKGHEEEYHYPVYVTTLIANDPSSYPFKTMIGFSTEQKAVAFKALHRLRVKIYTTQQLGLFATSPP